LSCASNFRFLVVLAWKIVCTETLLWPAYQKSHNKTMYSHLKHLIIIESFTERNRRKIESVTKRNRRKNKDPYCLSLQYKLANKPLPFPIYFQVSYSAPPLDRFHQDKPIDVYQVGIVRLQTLKKKKSESASAP
jgi:hypothetical protein